MRTELTQRLAPSRCHSEGIGFLFPLVFLVLSLLFLIIITIITIIIIITIPR